MGSGNRIFEMPHPARHERTDSLAFRLVPRWLILPTSNTSSAWRKS